MRKIKSKLALLAGGVLMVAVFAGAVGVGASSHLTNVDPGVQTVGRYTVTPCQDSDGYYPSAQAIGWAVQAVDDDYDDDGRLTAYGNRSSGGNRVHIYSVDNCYPR